MRADWPGLLQLAAKRAIDALVAGMMLVLLSPLLATIGVLIRLESRGPALFSQLRWGARGRTIRIYKFRTMRTDLCDPTGVEQTRPGDPRVTRLGAFLRRTSIDELPQLFNVLKGEMSLVGPRCHPIGMLAAGRPYEELVPRYHRRHVMRPGITGLAQVKGLRGPTTDAAKARARIAYDIYYTRNFSLWLDAKIAAGTIVAQLRGGGGF